MNKPAERKRAINTEKVNFFTNLDTAELEDTKNVILKIFDLSIHKQNTLEARFVQVPV